MNFCCIPGGGVAASHLLNLFEAGNMKRPYKPLGLRKNCAFVDSDGKILLRTG